MMVCCSDFIEKDKIIEQLQREKTNLTSSLQGEIYFTSATDKYTYQFIPVYSVFVLINLSSTLLT